METSTYRKPYHDNLDGKIAKTPEYLLQEKWITEAKRAIKKVAGLVKAEYIRRTKKEGRKLFFIVYDTRYKNVIPVHTDNGVVIRGGLLNFIGKSALEHKAYVEGKHGKKLIEVDFISKTLTDNRIEFEVELDGVLCRFEADYKISKDYPTYFFIDLLNKKMINLNSERGLSEKQICALTYAAGFLYQQIFASGKNINIR